MGLVSTWLNGIGLGHAIATFKAAGIVTPSALAELDISHYEALGVSDPADRRKLFYLVQRIKVATQEDNTEELDTQQEIDDVVSRSLSSRNLNVDGRADHDDEYDDNVDDDGDDDEDGMNDLAVDIGRQEVANVDDYVTKDDDDDDDDEGDQTSGEPAVQQTKPASRTPVKQSSSAGRRSVAGNTKTRVRAEDIMRDKRQPVTRFKAKAFSSTSTVPAQQQSRRITTRSSNRRKAHDAAQQQQRQEMKQQQLNPELDLLEDDSGWEEESLIADDEASAGTTSRRFSRRIQDKRMSAQMRSSNLSMTSLDDSAEADGDETDENIPVGKAASRSKSETGYNADLEPSRSRGSSSRTRERRSTSDLDADDESSAKTPVTRKSGLQGPKTRRFESKLPGPTRTGKQLSTIPSETVAPMSPLVTIPSTQMDADLASQQKVDQKKRTNVATASRKRATARSKSMTSAEISSDTESDSASHPTLPHGLSSAASTSGSDTDGKGPTRPRRGRQSTSGIPVSRNRRVSSGLQSGLRKPTSTVSSAAAGKTNEDKAPRSAAKPFVHGGQTDTSWGAQVRRLREDNQSEFDLFQAGQELTEAEEEMRIRVIVRKRPMSTSELGVKKELDVIHPLQYDDYGRILVYQPKTRVDLTREVETVPFAFDNVFDEESTNRGIYQTAVRNLIPGVFEGKWASVFAYGQTGSGKTFTMMGSNVTGVNAGTATKDKSNFGLYYMAALDVFSMAKQEGYQHLSIGASLFEIYGGKLFDLLNGRKQVKCLEDHKGRVCFPGLSEHPVASPIDLMDVINDGACNRSTGTTSKNADSSRSHAVLQLCLRKSVGRKSNVEHGKSHNWDSDDVLHSRGAMYTDIRMVLAHWYPSPFFRSLPSLFVLSFQLAGRLTFIDLAGSERGADTAKASRATRLEGAEINTSLLALKEVIRALATGDSMAHIPFRGSKLTQVLKESFVGKNSRTVMVACIAPNISNCEHTLNTLRYADRVKERNSETGNLSASVAAGKIRSSKRTLLPSFDSVEARETGGAFDDEGDMDDYGEDEVLGGDDYNDDEDIDDDLVSDQVGESFETEEGSLLIDDDRPEVNLDDLPSQSASAIEMKSSVDCEETVELVNTHRSVMTEMLRMVKVSLRRT